MGWSAGNSDCKYSSVENSDKENRKWQDAPSSPTQIHKVVLYDLGFFNLFRLQFSALLRETRICSVFIHSGFDC
jgi:hypothetical protein